MIDEWTNKIHCGHVLDILRQMPNELIDVCVTSPPYWGLRDYGDVTSTIWDEDINCKHEWKSQIKRGSGGHGKTAIISKKAQTGQDYGINISNSCIKCGAWNGQLGLEPHPQMYIDHLVEIFRELRRVLKGSGSLWLNLGDTYCSNWGGGRGGAWWSSKINKEERKKWKANEHPIKPNWPRKVAKDKKERNWLQPKQKMLIPERVAIALQEDGWILRNKIIWYKPNAMPSSVKDRLNTTYESIFFFVKQRKYYFDLDSIRVPHKQSTIKREKYGHGITKATLGNESTKGIDGKFIKLNILGKNPGDMWTINTKPFKGAHFAVYPTTLIEKILKATGPKEVCNRCGKLRERIIKTVKPAPKGGIRNVGGRTDGYTTSLPPNPYAEKEFLGWSKCNCEMEFKSGIVLDIFMGSGTTALVAKQLGLNWIGIELNEKYAREIAIPRIGSGTVEMYKVNRSKISKVVKESIKVLSNVPIGNKPQCNYKEPCNFKINNICYMDKKKRVKYCPGIKQ